MIIVGAFLILATGIVALVKSRGQVHLPVITGTLRFSRSDIAAINVIANNPRKIGAHIFTHQDSGRESTSWSIETPIEVWDYPVEIIRYCRLREQSQFVLPVFEEYHSGMSGPNGEIEAKLGPLFVTTYTTYRNHEIGIPVSDGVVEYIFLLRAMKENTGWRVYQISASEITRVRGGDPLIIPDLLTLPLHTDKQEWAKLMATAEAYDKVLRSGQ